MAEQEITHEQNKDLQASSNNEMLRETEFYIGWQPKAPFSFSKHVKKVLLVLFTLAIVIGLLLAFNQKKFSTANFEFGTLTEVKGVYYNSPVPILKITDRNNISVSVPLVGYGKHGAEGIIKDIEKEKSVSLNGKMVTLKGTLLYSNGKLLMQIDEHGAPFVKIENTSAPAQSIQQLGTITVKGEVIDPKCYFGVMKPGEGKVHKDCAIRCILGGIPPVLKVMNEKGETNFYLIAGPDGEKMNEAVKDFVAEPVEIHARAVQIDDWIVLYTESSDIRSISKREILFPQLQIIACTSQCMK
jgi:hypothetical protein